MLNSVSYLTKLIIRIEAANVTGTGIAIRENTIGHPSSIALAIQSNLQVE